MPPVPKRSPWRRVVLGVLILVCGAAIGAGGGNIVTKTTTRKRIWSTWGSPSRTSEYMARRIEKELELSPEQAAQVKDIVQQRMEAVREILEQTRPQRDEQYELMKQEVAEVLNPTQAAEWQERFDQLRRSRGSSRSKYRNGSSDGHRHDRDRDSSDHDSDSDGSGSKQERWKDRSAGPEKQDASESAGSA